MLFDLAVKVAEERLREDASLEKRTCLLSFYLKTTQFACNDTYYQQVLVQLWVRPSLLSLPKQLNTYEAKCLKVLNEKKTEINIGSNSFQRSNLGYRGPCESITLLK